MTSPLQGSGTLRQTAQERQAGRARSSAGPGDLLRQLQEDLHGCVLRWKGTHGTQVNTPCLTTPALWGCPCAGTRSLHRAPCCQRPWSPSPRSSPCPPDPVTSTVSPARSGGKLYAPRTSASRTGLCCGHRERHRQHGDGHVLLLSAPGQGWRSSRPCRASTGQGDVADGTSRYLAGRVQSLGIFLHGLAQAGEPLPVPTELFLARLRENLPPLLWGTRRRRCCGTTGGA